MEALTEDEKVLMQLGLACLTACSNPIDDPMAILEVSGMAHIKMRQMGVGTFIRTQASLLSKVIPESASKTDAWLAERATILDQANKL